MIKRVMITGITGYIGSNLARKLIEQGIKVVGLAREPWNTMYIADIKDKMQLFTYDGTCESIKKTLTATMPDVVFHLATYYARSHGSDEIAAMHECNLIYGNYLLEAMKECGVNAIVYASTVFCHYQQEQNNPLNLYAATKQAFSDIMRYYTEACGIRSLTIFLSDSYGPGDRRPKLLNLLKRACKENTPMNVSSGLQDYDVLYISDIVSALIRGGQLVQEQETPSVSYQIYDETCLSLRDTVTLMEKVNQVTIPANWGANPASPRSNETVIRVDPLLPEWEPKVPLEEGLKRFWE